MIKILLLLASLTTLLLGQKLLVIGDKNFPENNLTKPEIKAIFLNKKRFIEGKKILVMNHEFNHPLRLCFEKNILEKSERSLEKYWRKAYYNGKRPPKIVSSEEMLFLYLERIQPSIGYVEQNMTRKENIKILYKVECP